MPPMPLKEAAMNKRIIIVLAAPDVARPSSAEDYGKILTRRDTSA